jgi:hypothetical protein
MPQKAALFQPPGEISGLVAPALATERNAVYIRFFANHPFICRLRNNSFNHANDVGYDVRIDGAGVADSDLVIDYVGNKHGSPTNGRVNSTVEDCVIISSCNLHGQIAANSFCTRGDGGSVGGFIRDCLDVTACAGPAVNTVKIYGNHSREYLSGAAIENSIEAFQEDGLRTFGPGDATPSVAYGRTFETDAGMLTITDFDHGYPGQEIVVISRGAVTFDTTGTSLVGSFSSIVTADGDVTRWVMEGGSSWRLTGFVDSSVDSSVDA